SEYIQFERWILILIAAAFVIRLALPLAGGSVASTRSGSINILVFIGVIYCSIAVFTREFGGYKQLFGLLLDQKVFSHMLIAFGIVLGILTGTDNIYTAPEFFGGSSGRNWLHVLAHTVAAFVVPVFAWLVGSVILFVTKRVKKGT